MSEKFKSGGEIYNITVYPGPDKTKKYPVILLLHGNGSFRPPFGGQIHDFAENLAKLGYVTAVPGYYVNDIPPPFDRVDTDPAPHVQTLVDAIGKVGDREDINLDRLGLIGYSLGAAVAMNYIASNPKGTVKVLADFFGPLDETIRAGVSNFPPTIMFHNKSDELVVVANSEKLDELLTSNHVEHTFTPPYDEFGQPFNHPFKPGGVADEDSRKKTTDWFVKHL